MESDVSTSKIDKAGNPLVLLSNLMVLHDAVTDRNFALLMADRQDFPLNDSCLALCFGVGQNRSSI